MTQPVTPPKQTYVREWEVVTAWMKRMKVPSGWIVYYFENEFGPTICFVPDANYDWILA